MILMTRKLSLISLFSFLFFASFASAQHEAETNLDPPIVPYVRLASELSSRARANVYFANPQNIFRGVQFNYVNVGFGNLTFLRRDLVATGRIPIVFARVYGNEPWPQKRSQCSDKNCVFQRGLVGAQQPRPGSTRRSCKER